MKKLAIKAFKTQSNHTQDIILSYEHFGLPLNQAPVVLVNHALTGNSNVAGEGGWWSALIGPDKCIDTNRFAVLAFNIPGEGTFLCIITSPRAANRDYSRVAKRIRFLVRVQNARHFSAKTY